jgi:2-oxo-4-hydroxy-4-carboxy-5-ureidoimidazoline decarboxylase
MDSPLPVAEKCSEQDFVAAFGSVYEHSAWVAKGAWAKVQSAEIRTFGELGEAMARFVAAASDGAKLDLLRAHPELAGKAALAGNLTEASNREQSGAGLDRCTPGELARIQSLNAEYREKFGFPFIVAVTGLTRGDIIAAMASRLANSHEAEMAEALRQVDRIAEIRLAALASRSEELNQ